MSASTTLPRGKDEFTNPPYPHGMDEDLTEEVTSAYLDARDGHLKGGADATWDAIKGVWPVERQLKEQRRK